MLGKRKTAGRNLYWLQAGSDAADLNPDDPVWKAEPVPGDETVSESDIDDVLYGDLNE
jgi:hypothetical protein